jgi:hypothetical protein
MVPWSWQTGEARFLLRHGEMAGDQFLRRPGKMAEDQFLQRPGDNLETCKIFNFTGYGARARGKYQCPDRLTTQSGS